MSDELPFCSVVMPAHQASLLLPRTLGALVDSDYPRDRWELIVVDDASADDSATVAARYADTVIRLPGNPHGPAYARNRGFEVSRGEIVMFFDSDVVVRKETIRRFVEVLTSRTDVGAVFGAYDDEPTDRGFMSQYRNLLHHYTHSKNSGEVETFWAGAGAVRRDVFDEAGMYDEWLARRSRTSNWGRASALSARGSFWSQTFRLRTSSAGPLSVSCAPIFAIAVFHGHVCSPIARR
jgi:glycosyltransferase involved in cell wall biosynthesis